jgi:hypothetical protein
MANALGAKLFFIKNCNPMEVLTSRLGIDLPVTKAG